MGSSNGSNIMVKTYLTKRPLTTNFINQKSSKQFLHLRSLWHTIQLSNPPSDNDIVTWTCFSFDMVSTVNSPQRCSFTEELNYPWSSVFPILDFCFALIWHLISISNSALLCISFLILFMYCLCWQCQCVWVSCMWKRERESVCVCERKACLTASVL